MKNQEETNPTDFLRELRIEIDGTMQLVGDLTGSRQTQIAEDALSMAKAWLGKLLGEIGEQSPYGNDYKTKEDIQPTADVAVTVDSPYYDQMGYIEKVLHLRELIQDLAEEVKELSPAITDSREKSICRTNAWNYLSEAKMHLGFELQRIKNEG